MPAQANQHFTSIWLDHSIGQLNYLFYSLDNSDIIHPFTGNNAKDKIAIYQLKKSQLDFRLVFLSNENGEFEDLNASCRSNALLEGKISILICIKFNSFLVEEGTECRKLSSL